MRRFGSHGTANGRFADPWGVAIGRAGRIYVADSSNNRIQVFNRRGRFIRSWGGRGSVNGKFSYPRGIATDPQGRVYVVDGSNHRIQMFNARGRFIRTWGREGERTDRLGIHATLPSTGAAGSW